MTLGEKIYREKEASLRKECDEAVENGEMTKCEAEFRFLFIRDELLDSIPDELFNEE